MRIAVIGPNGQMGSEIVRACAAAGVATLELRHADCDVTDTASVVRALAPLHDGDVVVNTAAFHKTDECEDLPDRALSVNALGAFRVAAAARERETATVYLSSDFVFDGLKRSPYVESDEGHPLNVYGASKLAGEALLAATNPRHYVMRISAVFGAAGASGKGGNFVESMVEHARAGRSPEVVDDIVMAPTSAADAATTLVELVRRQAPFGIYHLSNAGSCSWREFADAVFEDIGAAVRARPIAAASLNGKAQRPLYSVLASERLPGLGLQPREWRPALSDYLRAKGYR